MAGKLSGDSRGRHATPRAAVVGLAVATLGYVASVVPGVRRAEALYVPVLDFGLTTVVMLLAAWLCLVRARGHRRERAPWTLVAAGIVVYLLGNVYYYTRLAHLPPEQVPYPSLADAGWVGWYPLLTVALLLLVRARLRGAPSVLWLDGLIAGSGAAAVAGALFLQPLLGVADAGLLLVVTNLAYPVADLALLTVVVLVFHLTGWRPDRTWWWIAAGAVVLVVGDTVYMLQLAAGTYVDGTLLDASWTLVCACFGLAAASRPPVGGGAPAGRVALVVPATSSLAGTLVLFAGASQEISLPVVVCSLALVSVLLASGRLLLTLRETQRLSDARREARTDELTGLANRRQLMDRLEHVLLLDKRRHGLSAVLLIDLDRFKEVNDTLGHQHGDLLLQAVAQRLGSIFREYDTVARLGGDEFAVLLPQVSDVTSAEELAGRCIAALEDDFVIDGLSLHVEASVGLAVAPLHGDNGNDLMRAADVAMYEAKARHAGVVVYDAGSDLHTPHRLAVLGDLRRALQNDELVLHYQPKVVLGTGDVTGVEALARWNHPSRGLLSPADFISIAEGTGLIMPLTVRTLELAVADAVRWRREGYELQVAVNLSPRCLIEPTLAGRIEDLLHRHGLPPQLLRLELTESTVMVDPPRSLAVLSDLAALGVSLSIDDFGTGYSSMSYLKRMPVDELKIDRSFVMDMLASGGDTVLVRSSIDLGHNLGMSIVAEGVEDAATMAALSALDCDVVQGYHLAHPMEPGRVVSWLEQRRDRRAVADEGVPAAGRAPAPTW